MRTLYIRLASWTKPLEGKGHPWHLLSSGAKSCWTPVWLCCPCLRLPTASHHDPVLQLCFWLAHVWCSGFRLKFSIPDVCLKIILIIFLLSLSKWFDHSGGWSSSFICAKNFLFPYCESQMRIFDTWGDTFLFCLRHVHCYLWKKST